MPQLSTERLTNSSMGGALVIRILNHNYFLWFALSVPGLWIAFPVLTGSNYLGQPLVESGEWGIRLLTVTLAITPLSLLFKGRDWVRWLIRHRRHFGVASFGYAALHVAIYVWQERSWGAILFEASRLYAWSGWVAGATLLVLALTSNDFSQALLRRLWKMVQRLSYIAAVLAVVHWFLLVRGAFPTFYLQAGALIALEVFRIGYRLRQMAIQRRRARLA